MTNGHSEKDIWGKLDVLGKLASSVVLAAIALFIKIGADDIAVSLKRGQMVQSLLSDLTAQEQKARQDIALIALDHSIGDEQPFLVSDIAERVYQDMDDAGQDVEGGNSPGRIAFAIIKKRNPQRAKEIEEELKKQISYLRTDLRSDASTAAARRQSPTAQLIARAFSEIVYIQFKNEDSRKRMEELQSLCQKEGWLAPGVERVAAKFSNGIRYYHPEDKVFAEKVAGITNQYLKQIGSTLTVGTVDLSQGKFKAKRGQVEIWLNL